MKIVVCKKIHILYTNAVSLTNQCVLYDNQQAGDVHSMSQSMAQRLDTIGSMFRILWDVTYKDIK